MSFSKKYVFIIPFTLCFPCMLHAQVMSYDDYQPAPDYTENIENRDKDRTRSIYLDNELENLPSDVTFMKWSKQREQMFRDLDVDNDTVLSEEDLVRIDEEKAIDWAEKEVTHIFSFWIPDFELHMEAIEIRTTRISSINRMLNSTKMATEAVEDALLSMGLGKIDKNVYVKSEPLSESRIDQAARINKTSRSWVQITIPFEMSLFLEGEISRQKYTATILAMKRFPRYEEDDTFALWDIKISGY